MTESAINAGLARDSAASGVPEMSVVIACYNDWRPLHQCLQSLAEQSGAPAFEVIVVDDGSRQTTPDFIAAWTVHLSLKILRQPHAGISAARNHGVQSSRGEVVVFVDADCKLQKHCLAVLAAVIVDHPQRNYFQLRLIGDCSRLVGRAEELRLIIIQQHMLQPDGCIRYLNTAGFAIRREHTDLDGGVFDPAAQRAEDTLFLANLMQSGELPFFVENAIVQHAIPLNLAQCLAKDVRSALLEARTYDVIAAKGVKFRVSHRERLSLLRLMWVTSAQRSIGRAAWFVLATRQALRLVILRALDWSGRRFEPRVEAKSS
jgi:glycosyltransferase involved in cell wall biosynthesis